HWDRLRLAFPFLCWFEARLRKRIPRQKDRISLMWSTFQKRCHLREVPKVPEKTLLLSREDWRFLSKVRAAFRKEPASRMVRARETAEWASDLVPARVWPRNLRDR